MKKLIVISLLIAIGLSVCSIVSAAEHKLLISTRNFVNCHETEPDVANRGPAIANHATTNTTLQLQSCYHINGTAMSSIIKQGSINHQGGPALNAYWTGKSDDVNAIRTWANGRDGKIIINDTDKSDNKLILNYSTSSENPNDYYNYLIFNSSNNPGWKIKIEKIEPAGDDGDTKIVCEKTKNGRWYQIVILQGMGRSIQNTKEKEDTNAQQRTGVLILNTKDIKNI